MKFHSVTANQIIDSASQADLCEHAGRQFVPGGRICLRPRTEAFSVRGRVQ